MPIKDGSEGHDAKHSYTPFSNSREAGSICQQLEDHNKRSMGAKLRADTIPPTTPRSKGASVPTERIPVTLRSAKNDGQTCDNHRSKVTGKQGVSVTTLRCPQKRWRNETSDQPEGTCGDTPLQDGRHPSTERRIERRRLDDKGGSEGRVLHNPNEPRPSTPPEIQV